MSDRDKAGLRGPVKTVLDEQTFSGANGQQLLTTSTTDYAPDGRILEVRTRNPDGSEWVTSYTYHSDRRLLKTVSGKVNSAPSSETTYQYDGHGNWTEQTTVARYSRDAALGPGSIRHRKLTYY